jgi:hypothetical protein
MGWDAPNLGLRPNQTVGAALWQILDVNLFRLFLLTRDEFWHKTVAIGRSLFNKTDCFDEPKNDKIGLWALKK